MSTSPPTPQAPTADNHQPADNGRDARGRFIVGNAGGPGNPFARQVAWLRSVLINAVTEDDMRQIARELIDRARRGNVGAAKLLFQYVLGKPAETVNPDTLDMEEWRQRYAPLGAMMEQLKGAVHSVGADTARDMVEVAHMAGRARLVETIERSLERADRKANREAKKNTVANLVRPSAPSGKTAKKDEQEVKSPSTNGHNGAQAGHRPPPSTNEHNGARAGHRPPLGGLTPPDRLGNGDLCR